VYFRYINTSRDLIRQYKYNQLPLSLYVQLNVYEGWNFNSGNYLFTTDTK